MTQKPITTSWMWKQDDETVWALVIHADTRKVEWYDGLGCACDDGFQEQSFEDFLTIGPRYGDPPPDVLAEIYESLAVLGQKAGI
jgi:hypothetical protein